MSVLIPTYNVSAYMDECISSVLNQTYKNLQIIVVDDGSTDGTYEKLQDYARQDKRIELYRHFPNQGAAATREETLSTHLRARNLNIKVIRSLQKIITSRVRCIILGVSSIFQKGPLFIKSTSKIDFIFFKNRL